VIDTMGRILLSGRIVNDESSLLELIATVLALGGADPHDGLFGSGAPLSKRCQPAGPRVRNRLRGPHAW
jgi:hypothetical protein